MSEPYVGNTILRYAKERPSTRAFHFWDGARITQTRTWGELGTAIRRCAADLLRTGVRPGDRILHVLDTQLEFFAWLFGAQIVGALPVAVSPPVANLRSEAEVAKVRAVAQMARARVVVAGGPYQELGSHVARAVDATLLRAEDAFEPGETFERDSAFHRVALIQFSSGTTGAAKGIVISQEALRTNCEATAEAFHLAQDSRLAHWCPLYHDMGLIVSLAGMLAGASLFVMTPRSFVLNPSGWLRLISEHRCTFTMAPNFGYQLCVRKVKDADLKTLDLSHWTFALTAAEPIRKPTVDAFLARFGLAGLRRDVFHSGYGLAENTVSVSVGRLDGAEAFVPVGGLAGLRADYVAEDTLAACLGTAVGGTRVRVVGEDGALLPDDTIGRIQISGSSLMDGYLLADGSLPDPTALPEWYVTGDLGFTRRGQLYFCGREKDLILRAGRNLYPEFLEQVLDDVPELRPGCIAVTGVPNADTGTDDIVVFAETREGTRDTARVVAKVRERLMSKVAVTADSVVLVASGQIPKTSSGKIQRQRTARLHREGMLRLFTVDEAGGSDSTAG